MKKILLLIGFLFVFFPAAVNAQEYLLFGYYVPEGWDLPKKYTISEYNSLGTLQGFITKDGNKTIRYDGVGRYQGCIIKQGSKTTEYDNVGNVTGYTIIKNGKITLYDSSGRIQHWWDFSFE